MKNKSLIVKLVGLITIILFIGGIIFSIYKYIVPLFDRDVDEDLDDVFGDNNSSLDDKFEE